MEEMKRRTIVEQDIKHLKDKVEKIDDMVVKIFEKLDAIESRLTHMEATLSSK